MTKKRAVSEAVQNKAKTQMRRRLVECARRRRMVTYAGLANSLSGVRLRPRDPRLSALLSEISKEEDAEGRGMLSAVVVHKQNELRPGKGFFDLAKRLGKDVSDTDKCWLEELRRVWRSRIKRSR